MPGLFRLSPAPTFTAPIQITRPGEPVGEITFTFRHQSRPDLSAWIAGAKGRQDIDVLMDVVCGWAGPVDDTGAAVPFSKDALLALLADYHAATREIYMGYLRAIGESRIKN